MRNEIQRRHVITVCRGIQSAWCVQSMANEECEGHEEEETCVYW